MSRSKQRMDEIRNMKIPEVPPRLDMNVNSVDRESKKVLTNILNRDNDKHILREYDDMAHARKSAVMIASTLGVNGKGNLDRWLRERGFDTLYGEKYINGDCDIEGDEEKQNQHGSTQKTQIEILSDTDVE